MKKVILILICFSYFQIKAQSNAESILSPWSIDTYGGGSLLPDFKEQLQNYKLGINGGIFGSLKYNKNLSFKLGAGFNQKGKSYSYQKEASLFTNFNDLIGSLVDTAIIGSVKGYVDDGVYSNYNGYHKLSYIEIPILAEFSYLKFKIAGGPFLGFLVKSYTKESLEQNIPLLDLISPAIDSLGFASLLVKGLINNTFPGYNQTDISEYTTSDIFTKLNYGFIVQLSYQIYKQTYLQASFSRNLNSYLNNDTNDARLSSFSLSLTYNFELKKLRNE